jgi:hypothetical protein
LIRYRPYYLDMHLFPFSATNRWHSYMSDNRAWNQLEATRFGGGARFRECSRGSLRQAQAASHSPPGRRMDTWILSDTLPKAVLQDTCIAVLNVFAPKTAIRMCNTALLLTERGVSMDTVSIPEVSMRGPAPPCLLTRPTTTRDSDRKTWKPR